MKDTRRMRRAAGLALATVAFVCALVLPGCSAGPAPVPVDMAVDASDAKGIYALNERFDSTGVTAEVTMSDGTGKVVDESELGFSVQLGKTSVGNDADVLDREGGVDVRVSYGGLTAEYGVTVLSEIEGVEIRRMPRNEYAEGERFDATGLVLAVSTAGGKSMDIPFRRKDMTFSGEKSGALVSGETEVTQSDTVTVDFMGFKVVYEIACLGDRMPVPTASVESGLVTYGTKVTLSSLAGATIHYTLDGSDPAVAGKIYVPSEPIMVDKDMTIKAMASRYDLPDSDILTVDLKLNMAPPEVKLYGKGTADAYSKGVAEIEIAFATGSMYPGGSKLQYRLMPKGETSEVAWSDYSDKVIYENSGIVDVQARVTSGEGLVSEVASRTLEPVWDVGEPGPNGGTVVNTAKRGSYLEVKRGTQQQTASAWRNGSRPAEGAGWSLYAPSEADLSAPVVRRMVQGTFWGGNSGVGVTHIGGTSYYYSLFLLVNGISTRITAGGIYSYGGVNGYHLSTASMPSSVGLYSRTF